MRLVKGITPLTENFPERNIVHMNIAGHPRAVCLHTISTKSFGSPAKFEPLSLNTPNLPTTLIMQE
jgi:hypothetical protein